MARRIAHALGRTQEQLSSLVEEALTRTRQYATSVMNTPESDAWMDKLAALAGAVGLIALAALAVEAIVQADQKPKPPPKKPALRRR